MSMVLPGITPGGGLGAYQGQLNQNPSYMAAFNNDQSTVGNIIAKNTQTAQAATPAALTSLNTQGDTIAQEQQTTSNNSTQALNQAQANEQQALQTKEYQDYATQQAQQYAQQAQQNAENYTQSGLSNAVNGLNANMQAEQGSTGQAGSGGPAPTGPGGPGQEVSSTAKGARNQDQYVANGVAGGGTNAAGTYYWAPESGLSSERNSIMEDAFNYIGDPYTLGGIGTAQQAAKTGIDCSGLVEAVYSQFGFSQYVNSHGAIEQGQKMSAIGTRTAVSNLQAGDLVWWPSEGHIAIYAGNGMIVAAASPGEGVKLQPVWGDAQGIALNLGSPTSSKSTAQ